MFSLEVNGYNKEEVEEKISALEEEIMDLELACKEKDDINLKLAGAVDKAKEIHSTSQNLFRGWHPVHCGGCCSRKGCFLPRKTVPAGGCGAGRAG